MNTKKILALILVLMLLFAPQAVSATEDTSEGLVLNIGAAVDFKNNQDSVILIYDTLLAMEPGYKPLPALAQSWEISEDYTVYTFQITEDVVFSDGSLLTLEDFEESLKVLAKNYYLSFVDKLESIALSDDGLLTVTFLEPHLNFLNEVVRLPIIKAGSLNEEGQIEEYIGTGPFVLTEYEAQVSAKLSINPLHRRAEEYALTELNWRVISDAQSRKMALLSGQVDVIGISEHWPSVPLAMSNELKQNDSLAFVEQNKEYYTIVKGLALNWKTGPLSDQALRQAIMYTLDREAYNQIVLFGEGEACGHLFNPLFADGPKEQEAFDYDLDKARAILEAAGYQWEDGKLTKDGEPIVLRQIIAQDEQSTDTAVFIQNALKEIGIEVVIEGFDTKLLGAERENGNFDIAPTHAWFEPLISSMKFGGFQTEFSQSGLGFGVNEQAVEAGKQLLLVKTAEELEEVSQAYWAAQYEGCSYLPLYTSGRVAFFNKDFEGFYYPGWVSHIDLSGVRKAD